MKRDSGADGGSGKGQRRKPPPTLGRARKALRPRASVLAATEAVVSRPVADQGALDELHIDLRASEERWHSLLENPIFGVTFLSKDMRYEGSNQTFQSMVGYTADELQLM